MRHITVTIVVLDKSTSGKPTRQFSTVLPFFDFQGYGVDYTTPMNKLTGTVFWCGKYKHSDVAYTELALTRAW